MKKGKVSLVMYCGKCAPGEMKYITGEYSTSGILLRCDHCFSEFMIPVIPAVIEALGNIKLQYENFENKRLNQGIK